MARAIGRTKDIDSAHRRDGLAMALIAVAMVTAAGVWWRAGGPVGAWAQRALGGAIGTADLALPVVLFIVGVVLMRTEPRPETRPG